MFTPSHLPGRSAARTGSLLGSARSAPRSQPHGLRPGTPHNSQGQAQSHSLVPLAQQVQVQQLASPSVADMELEEAPVPPIVTPSRSISASIGSSSALRGDSVLAQGRGSKRYNVLSFVCVGWVGWVVAGIVIGKR